jgi:hypothetical protein
LEALVPYGPRARPFLTLGLRDVDRDVREIALKSVLREAPDMLTNVETLTLFASGLRSGDPGSSSWAARALRAAGQQARGEQPEFRFSRPDVLRTEATNVLRELAPGTLGQ